MSDIRNLEAAASSTILHLIPVELWTKILHTEHGFTVEDFKALCFVAPYFKQICQPWIFESLTAKGAKVTHEYSFETGWGSGEMTHNVDQWKRDVEGLVRAERRFRLVGGHASLSNFPKVISIGVMPRYLSPQQILPLGKSELSKTAYAAFSQFRNTFVRTLPLFNHLRRLEIGTFPVCEGILEAIASHPTIYELKLGACSFSSQTFPIPSIRLLELDTVSREQAPAAFRVASSRHLQELHIRSTEMSAILEGFSARPKSESILTNVHRLLILPTGSLKLVDVETLLSHFPALQQLDISEATITVPEGGHWQAMKPSTVPNLRQFSGPQLLAQCLLPGRPVSDIRCRDGYPAPCPETLAGLQSYLKPLCSQGAEGIKTLHLPDHKIGPIWLLSRLVAELFPNLVELKMPVHGLPKPKYDFSDLEPYPIRSCCGLREFSRRRPRTGEKPFKQAVAEMMVRDIKDNVESELVGVDYAAQKISPAAAIPATVSSLDVDAAETLANLCNDVVIDKEGVPSRYPKDFQEALVYLARGWYPLPAGIQTLSLRPGTFRSSHMLSLRTWSATMSVAIATALGERYPSLCSVALLGHSSYYCERALAIGSGTARWTAFTA